MFGVNAEVDSRAVEVWVSWLEERFSPTKILDESGAILLSRIRRRFLNEVDAEGTPWIPSQAGIKRRAGGFTYRNGKKYTGTGTLFETGNLFRSIQLTAMVDKTRTIKTDVPYAKYLIDRWDFLGFSDADSAFLEQFYRKRVEAGVF